MRTEELIRENQKDRIPVPERNDFQSFLMQKMGVKRHSGHAEVDWAEAYGRKVSEIIDNASEVEIRSLIEEGFNTQQEAMNSDSEEERQILIEKSTEAYDSAAEKVIEKIKKTLH